MSGDEQGFMTIRGYARSRSASEGTIRYHIRAGVIRLDERGRVDCVQADAAWARRRHQSRNDPGAQTANARIRRARAKLALARDEVARLDDEYAERDAAVRQFEAEAGYVLDSLRAMPAIEADHVAEQLGIPREKALALLDDFIALCLHDLGDLRAQLVGVVGRV
jgi:hypothetical protein